MSPPVTSLMTVMLLLVGAAAAVFIFEAQGRLKKTTQPKRLVFGHRICGYAFSLVLASIGVIMVIRSAGYQAEFSPRIILHIALAAAMAPILGFKIAVARRYRKHYAYLPALGGLLLTGTTVLTTVTAGYFFLYRPQIVFTGITPGDAAILEIELGRALTRNNCAKCHDLDRVLRASKDASGWTRTVNRMAVKDAPNIRPFDIKQVVHYLSRRQTAAVSPDAGGSSPPSAEGLVGSKCAGCHPLDRVYKKKRRREEWTKIIDQMIENAEEIGEFDFLTPDEKRRIIRYLEQALS